MGVEGKLFHSEWAKANIALNILSSRALMPEGINDIEIFWFWKRGRCI